MRRIRNQARFVGRQTIEIILAICPFVIEINNNSFFFLFGPQVYQFHSFFLFLFRIKNIINTKTSLCEYFTVQFIPFYFLSRMKFEFFREMK